MVKFKYGELKSYCNIFLLVACLFLFLLYYPKVLRVDGLFPNRSKCPHSIEHLIVNI